MANYNHLIRELSRLDPYEKAGFDSFRKTGTMLRHGQYLYLMMHGTDRHTLEAINDLPALREQGQIVASFHEKYRNIGLTETDFMPSDMNVTIEKLLRYIEIPAHSHEFIECAYVLRGSCIHRVGENEVIQQEGSFILIPVPTRHQLIAVGDSLCLTMKIRVSHFVKMSIPHLPSMIYPISFQCGEDPAAESMLLFLYEQQKLSLPYRNELMESTAAALITYILQRYMDTMQPLYSIALRDKRLLDMVNYMYNHYRTITLHDLAAEFHYNESYLSRMFQEQAGRSFSETVKDFKLRKAAELLKTKNWKLNQICDEIGYKDTRQFIRGFKEMYGVTPDKFRKSIHVETVCLLSKIKSAPHIDIDLDMTELDVTKAETKATYEEIKTYVLEHTGLKVSHLYIAQVKAKHGIIERDCYNKPKTEGNHVSQCPPEKEKAIEDALRHFQMITD